MTRRHTRDFSIGPFERSATAWLDDASSRPTPAVPVRAATVMLVRGDPLEVFMIERAPTMDFAPSTWVFPGGRVDPSDADDVDGGDVAVPLVLARGGAAAWAGRLGLGEREALALLRCALRELFEEAGVLLASSVPEGPLLETTGTEWPRRREDVETHRTSFASAVAGSYLRGDLLEVVDRWVTPEFERRRFDTWFFVAQAPEESAAAALSRETTRGRWVRPSTMLDECARGEMRLLPPTMTALQRLGSSRSAAEARQQAAQAVFEPTHPRVLRGSQGLYLQAEVNL